MADPIRVFADDAVPYGDLYAERDERDLIERQQAAITVDMGQGGLDQAASGASKMPQKPKKDEGAGQAQQAQQADLVRQINDGSIRGALDATVRGLFGLGLDEIQQAVETGTLPEKVATMADIPGNAAETVAREQAAKSGMDAETTAKLVGVTGMLAGIVVPGPKGGKVGKGGAGAGAALKGTKVLDPGGQPKTVFHGTGAVFEKFDISKAHGRLNRKGRGLYFTEDPEVARGYATGPHANVKAVRLRLENPLDLEAQKTAPDPAVAQAATEIIEQYAELGGEASDWARDALIKIRDGANPVSLVPEWHIADVAQAAGHDGLSFIEHGKRTWVAFRSDQIVSAASETAETLAEANINLSRVGGEDSVKGTMAAINALHAEKLAGARKTISNKETIEQSQRLGLTLEQAASLDVEKYDLRVVQQAVRDYHNAASKHVDDLMRKTLAGDEEAAVQLNYAFAAAGDLSTRDELLGKIAARSLQARTIMSKAERAAFDPAQIADLAERLGGGLPGSPEELIERGKVLAQRLNVLSRDQRRQLERDAVAEARKGKSNVLYEAWMNWGLLSGPQTHVANMTSNALTTLWAPVERGIAAVADVPFSVVSGERSVYLGEAPAMMMAIPLAFRDAIVLAGKSLKTGQGVFGSDKVEIGADAARRVMQESDNTLGHATGFFAAAFRAPTRALTAEDSFFKVVNYRMELYAQAYREAAQQAGTGTTFADAFRRYVREHPVDTPDARAKNFALVQTFNREFSDMGRVGGMAGGLAEFADNAPGGRLVMPFIRTPANILHYASERTLGLNAFSDTLRKDIMAGGALRAEAIGKVAGGAMLGATVMYYSANGLITGGGPSDPVERAMWEQQDGRKPYSVRIGNEWVQYNRLDPLGMMLGTVSDAMDILGRLPNDSPYRLEVAGALSLALARNMVSKTYMQGVADLFETFVRPDRDILLSAKSLARSTVPSFVRTFERTIQDPERRMTRVPRQVYDEQAGKFVNDPMAEVNELLNEIRAQIPGLSDSLPPRRNRFGEVVLVPPGVTSVYGAGDILSPIYSTTVKEDPVAKEVARLRIGLPLPRPVVFGAQAPQMQMSTGREADYGIELNPQEYDRLLVLAGQGWGDHGEQPPFRQALAEVMRTPEYREAGDAGKRLIIERLDEAYKRAARAQLIVERPELEDYIRIKLEERANAIQSNPPVPETGNGLMDGLMKMIPGR